MTEPHFLVEKLSDGTYIAKFDQAVYRLSAVKKAAYKFGSLFHILIEQSKKHSTVLLEPSDHCKNPEASAGEFCNEVLDQELREQIAAETSGIRDLLLAHAFSKTALIESELETADYKVDEAGKGF